MVSEGPPKVAVIDDEPAVREVLEIGLMQEGFTVRSAGDGQAGLELVSEWEPDCVVLDAMLPKIDGIALIPELRRLSEVPIVMLTALGTVRDRVGGLKAGADDYVVKPFDLPELAVRLHAALRRPRLRDVRYLRFHGIELDLEGRSIARNGRTIELTLREFDLLAAFLRRPQHVYSREELLDVVWGVERSIALGTVDTYVSYLRAKVDAPGEPRLLHTVRSVGYVLRENA